ncbi:hypothetical protein MAR_005130 [Mya arenaria]|uniref:Uncharacterized protein n=1 Tax=Mya arenaria TaxID=6604 RepID=A0ABY7F089_MYAAR|nr:hypothetical protein MAR_005130 [Mya arenaria]
MAHFLLSIAKTTTSFTRAFVSPKDPSKEILVYVSPNVIGKWEIINAVINPKAEHKSTISVKIGKSKTFEYKWESSFGVEIKAITASVSQSVRLMIEKTSSETWTEEKKENKGDHRYAHPDGGRPEPGNDTKVVLHFDIHNAMRYQVEILVYGSPNVIGKWEIINAVINPKAKHKSTISVKIGKSKTESTTLTFEYKWESIRRVDVRFQATLSCGHGLM